MDALGGQARLDALGSAFALPHLIDFDEPFGLPVFEALTCGAPFIAFRRGSMPTIVRDRETGLVATSRTTGASSTTIGVELTTGEVAIESPASGEMLATWNLDQPSATDP